MDYSEQLKQYRTDLIEKEKSSLTTSKYTHDIQCFLKFLDGRELNKNEVLQYKEYLKGRYQVSSVNSMLSSLNSYFEFIDRLDLKVKAIRMQKSIFIKEEKMLTKREYEKILDAAYRKKDKRLYYLMQTICSTGIRVSEIRYITVESLKKGYAEISNKGKRRQVFLTKELCRMLREYCKARKIISGSVFVSKSGIPLDRSNIWHEMKALCKRAGVSREKVFPHNLRHLFARTFYAIKKDIVHLADILGHSNINTTRIYTADNGESTKRQLAMLGLLKC